MQHFHLHAPSTILYNQQKPCQVKSTSEKSFNKKQRLTLEGEGSADLVAGLVELGGVEGETEAEGGAGVELGAVGEGGDTTVVDLDLLRFCQYCWSGRWTPRDAINLPWRRSEGQACTWRQPQDQRACRSGRRRRPWCQPRRRS